MNEQGILLIEPSRVRHRLGAEELLELGRASGAVVADRRPFMAGRAAASLAQARPAGLAQIIVLAVVAAFAFGAALGLGTEQA